MFDDIFARFAVVAAMLFVPLVAVYGWVMNLLNVVNTEDISTISALFICQLIGILVFPVGAILGWLI